METQPPPHRPAPAWQPGAPASAYHTLISGAVQPFPLPQSSDPHNFSQDGAQKPDKSKRAYLCGKCGMKKKGHICGVILTTPSIKDGPVPNFVSTVHFRTLTHRPSPIRPVVRFPLNRPAMKPSLRKHTWRTQNFKWRIPTFQRQHWQQQSFLSFPATNSTAFQPESLRPTNASHYQGVEVPPSFPMMQFGQFDNLVPELSRAHQGQFGDGMAFGRPGATEMLGKADMDSLSGGSGAMRQHSEMSDPTLAGNMWLGPGSHPGSGL